MTSTAALRRAASINPKGLAISSGEERRTWPEHLRRVSAMAGALRSLGLKPGDRIATLSKNSPSYYELLMAIWWAGGVIVPLNTRLAYPELRYITGHSQSLLLFGDESFKEVGIQIGNEVPTLKAFVCFDGERYAEMIEHPPIDDACEDLHALAGICYTGGTTGLPKGVELTHLNFAFSAMGIQRELGHDTQTVYLHSTPLFHLADLANGLAVTFGCGTHSFIDQFTPGVFYRRLREEGVTHIQLVPTMAAMVLDAPERDDRLLSQIRSIAYGAAPISQALLARMVQGFPNARLNQFYGMTEACGASSTLAPDSHVLSGPKAGKLGSAGQVMPGFEIRVVDVHSRPCGPGETGEIQMRGPAIMRGYWKEPEKTAKTMVDGWLCSGDAGYLDDDGFLYVIDRIKDMIISGGENIYCAEVENALASHPNVDSCAVIGLPDERWGDRVHAVVVPRVGSTLSPSDLDTHCRALIAGYKVPRSYDIRSKPLPLSAVGKVQKTQLRDEWLAAAKAHTKQLAC
ncbi:AMP-binding protein [Variovorax sp. J22G21]|uniref:class I adenylate-forming enzyme family protein n=1 Tax=Variovorax fucosicus TaxID=3053517 RepID=UPI002575509F|nr:MULTISPECIES: AMP-binding protein [unclassified Variovorax]MDM0040745.1 AMP-binding protein [Variovorax sp. J22R193]MDM0062118.1 AMP-binding protein [Variovorax sp. J22G21]